MDISNVLLSLLIISINLREPFFHTREILYVLTMITSLIFLDIKNVKYALVLISIWAISILYNLIVPGSPVNFNNGGFETIIISAYLLLMCFCQERYARVIIRSYEIVSIIVAMIVVSIWIACYFSDSTYYSLRNFFINLRETTGLSLISIDKRMILGTRYLTVWYRTSPCMVCTLGYHLGLRLTKKCRNLLLISLLFISLLFTGTRANIISAVLLVCIYMGFKLYKIGFRLMPLVMISAVMIIAIIFVVKFLQDRNSQSSAIKTSDIISYAEIYWKDPVRTLLFGWAPGSVFFSRGRQKMVNITELSLLETIRRFGLVSTCIIMLGIWFAPFRGSNFKQMNYIKYFYCCVFGAYMLSALTNPYLLDSVGFCALLFLCTVFSYGDKKQQNKLGLNYLELTRRN